MRRYLLLASLSAVVLLLPACVGQLPPAGIAQLKEVDDTYRQANYRGTVVKADAFLAEYGQTEPAGEAYYLRGLAHVGLRDRTAAQVDFLKASELAHRFDLGPLAEVALGNLAFEDGHLKTAAEHYQPVLEKLPNEAPKDLVLYRLGICYARLGQWPAARDLFSKLVNLFPGSAMEPRARDYLAADGWSVECGSYTRPQEADAQADRLRKAGLTSVRRVQDVRLQRHFVQVGAYPTYREARTVLAQVLPVVPEAHIVPLP